MGHIGRLKFIEFSNRHWMIRLGPLVLRLTALARNERRAVERKIPLPLSVGAKPAQSEKRNKWRGPHEVGRRPFMPDSTLNRLRSDAPSRGRVIAVPPAGGHIL